MRSIPLAEFAPLSRLKGLHFFSLQKGPAVEELQSVGGRFEAIDLGSGLDENMGAFVETAAVLKNLDLLITCDTAIAHVAGALGVPVWVALCNVPDWRWLDSGETTAWYPKMRLFRQSEQGNWAEVMEKIAKELVSQFPEVETKQPADYAIATSGFNRLTRTRQGLMLYDAKDRQVGRSIERYGEYSADEGALFRQAIRPSWTVVEAGANIGAHTLTFSRLVGPRGVVFAFEPRRVVFQTLCANMALNSIVNVHCRPEALGNMAGRVQVPTHDGSGTEKVAAITLDSLELPRCQFLKVDVDGMELQVLKGAAKTIERLRPLLYVANERRELSEPVLRFLLALGYSLYWHVPPLFNSDNYYQNRENEFGNMASVNVFGVHSSIGSAISGMRKIDGPGEWASDRAARAEEPR
jgi:FkbM family methyltransferase